MTPRLKEYYKKNILENLQKKFSMTNRLMVPKFEKIILNMGLGLDGNDSKILKACQEDLSKIAGQAPVVTKFKKSIANFKTRKNTGK